MSATQTSNRLRRMVGGVLFLAAAIAAGLGFLGVFAPEPRVEPIPPFEGYDPQAMDQAVSVENVGRHLDAILGFGSRYPGQDGIRRTADYIRERYAAAGLEVIEIPHAFAVPVTRDRQILAAPGEPLEGVEIYPFQPNHFQPAVSPPEGVWGELLRVTDEVLLSRPSFSDCIAVIDAADMPKTFGAAWNKYAQLGFRAVVVTHRDGLEAIEWEKHPVFSGVPVNFVRVAATPAVLDHLGERVGLRVRVDWRNVPHTTFVGRLPSAAGAKEALLSTACYDACSVLPDLAPGALGALGLATQLAFLDGMQAYTEVAPKRAVVFVAYASQMMGQLGADRLSAVMGPALTRDEARVTYEEIRDEDRQQAERVAECAAAIGRERFLEDPDATQAAIDALSPAASALFDEELRYVLNTIAFERLERQVQARLAFLRAGEEDLTTPEYQAYRDAKRDYDAVMAIAGYPLPKIMETDRRTGATMADMFALAGRLHERFKELTAYHAGQGRALDASLAVHEALRPCERLIPVGCYLAPADRTVVQGERFSFGMGEGLENLNYVQTPLIGETIGAVLQRMPLPEKVAFDGTRPRGHNDWAHGRMAGLPVDTVMWGRKGHPGFVFLNTDRVDVYGKFGYPVVLPFMRDLETIASSLRVYGRAMLALAYGDGRFERPMKVAVGRQSGRVYASGVGRSIVPNYPMKYAMLGHKRGASGPPGYYEPIFIFCDAYGRYDLPFCSAAMTYHAYDGYNPEAVTFGEDGRIAWIKDEGGTGQAVYKSMNLNPWDAAAVNIVVFRASSVTLLDLINPQSMKAYTAVEFLTRDGLAPVVKRNVFNRDGIVTAFLEPDRRFYVALKAGAPDNELVQTTRAFLLGVPKGFEPAPGREIDGPGFLPADTDVILDVPERIARSMLSVNGVRLALQDAYGMADQRTRAFHQRSEGLLERAAQPGTPKHTASLDERDAATYTTLNHPVLRESIFESIVGILWYLGLLVPFVFFFEKLVFAFPDIRKQLAAQAVIFLVVFLLLRVLHPAFQMIRSSLMILLGFVIMLISGGITVLFAGKFQENLEELKAKRGQVSAAEVNSLGVMGTAFNLGLNNMHRRLVRTGLTCATLVLIVFAMICFTSVQSDIVNTTAAVGKAAYEGILINREKLYPISEAELFALNTKYGHRYDVAPRRMFVGSQGWDRINYNPELEAVYEPANADPKRARVASVMTFAPREPLRDRIASVAGAAWFPAEPLRAGEPPPVLIPDKLADALGVAAADVESGPVALKLNGVPVRAIGIFASDALGALRDLDGRDLLPFDIAAMSTVQRVGNSVLADDTDVRMDAGGIVLAPEGVLGNIPANRADRRLVSVAVSMSGIGYKAAKAEVDQYLEQSGQATYYGLDEVAYRGKRAREKSFAGLIELLIPLVIAAMTVLNTMRGSVYERRDEIFVYNAVGIAPRYIFGMFFSEAFVYAVVGSVLGYIFSQGVGRLLSIVGWTGGLNMTFTSITTIYASLAIMASVFLSTLFPARSAMEIAAPAEESGWDLPEPDGDSMAFALPFTFDAQARIAVLAFFTRHFQDHGEGSAGKFFASVPRAGVNPRGESGTDGYVPTLTTTIWLKPFDLGVSQHLTIAMPVDPETGEFIATVTLDRLSGSRESWIRLNHGFVMLLRQHFLYWRAVSPDERAVMFREARKRLESDLKVAPGSWSLNR